MFIKEYIYFLRIKEYINKQIIFLKVLFLFPKKKKKKKNSFLLVRDVGMQEIIIISLE